jgi:hypothetical protein
LYFASCNNDLILKANLGNFVNVFEIIKWSYIEVSSESYVEIWVPAYCYSNKFSICSSDSEVSADSPLLTILFLLFLLACFNL